MLRYLLTPVSPSGARVGCYPRGDACRRLCSQIRARLCVQVCFFFLPTKSTFDLKPLCDSQTFLSYIDKKNKDCNYDGYLDKHLKYPPEGPLPLPGQSVEFDDGCDLWSEIYEAALMINPAFDIYRIFDMVGVSCSLFLR